MFFHSCLPCEGAKLVDLLRRAQPQLAPTTIGILSSIDGLSIHLLLVRSKGEH